MNKVCYRVQWIKIRILIITGICFIGFLSTSICKASDDFEHEYHLENVNVLVFGGCRTLVSDGTWNGGLYRGNMSHAELLLIRDPFERLSVIVFNESIFRPWMVFHGLTYGSVFFRNADGVFFWSAKGSGVSYFAPLMFIRCHTEQFSIGYNESGVVMK